MKVLVIIPAYNEQENIERVVDNLVNNYPQYDYIVVNDGSKDNTAEICRKKGYHLIDLPVNLGLVGAVQTGMRYAAKMNYDAAVQLDGDGQHRPEYIGQMLQELSNAQIIIGSRFLEKPKPCSIRMMGSRLISWIIKCSTGVRLSDPTSGMRMFGRDILREFAYEINYGPEPDTISYLIKEGIKIKEIQVEMDERTAGTSYLTLVQAVKYMVLMCFSILFIQRFRKRRA